MKRPFFVLFLVFLSGCAATRNRSLPDGYLVAVVHSSGGPAPYAAWLGIYPNGEAIYRSASSKLTRIQVPRSTFARIQSALGASALGDELSSLTSRSEPFFDHEQVSFLLHGREYKFVCREVPPAGAVLELVRTLRALGRFRLGDRPFLGPACTSESSGIQE